MEAKPLAARQLSRCQIQLRGETMSKEKKSNKETKKAKAPGESNKKVKKDPKRHDGPPK
jgi:hypothetical protein